MDLMDQSDSTRQIAVSLNESSEMHRSRGQRLFSKRKNRIDHLIQEDVEKPNLQFVKPENFNGNTPESRHQLISETINTPQLPLLPRIQDTPNNIQSELKSESGKGAKMFSSRREYVDRWTVDDTNVQPSAVHQPFEIGPIIPFKTQVKHNQSTSKPSAPLKKFFTNRPLSAALKKIDAKTNESNRLTQSMFGDVADLLTPKMDFQEYDETSRLLNHEDNISESRFTPADDSSYVTHFENFYQEPFDKTAEAQARLIDSTHRTTKMKSWSEFESRYVKK